MPAAEVRVLAGGAWKRQGRTDRTLTVPTPPQTVAARGPVSVADVNEYISKGLGSPPANANYVLWRWPVGTDLQTVFASLGSNDILVLPEDENPYVVHQMYRTADGTQNGASPRTDRSASRSKRGVIGLGPNAVVSPSASFPTYAQQTGTDGCRESLIECWTNNSYHGNFTIKGRNVGGLAYAGLKLDSNGTAGNPTVERLHTINHYGFLGHQPGEAMGILMQNHTGTGTIRRCEIDASNPVTGEAEGSGGIHLVKGGAVLIEDTYVHSMRGQGIALYWRLGPTTMRRTTVADVHYGVSGHYRALNLEVCGTNDVTLEDCSFQMHNNIWGGDGGHIAIASVTASAASYPKGNTQVYATNLAYDEAAVRVWVADGRTSSKYGAYPNTSTRNDFHVSPSVPAIFEGFK